MEYRERSGIDFTEEQYLKLKQRACKEKMSIANLIRYMVFEKYGEVEKIKIIHKETKLSCKNYVLLEKSQIKKIKDLARINFRSYATQIKSMMYEIQEEKNGNTHN
jgi:hypothetical protein